MASYRVPQDVEADDKLIGPFSFRQFIYLMIVAGGIGIGYALFLILPPLVVIPLPIVLFFGALALPLRKDQPMEIYLAAILSFYLKPRRRMWEPDGIETLVNIAAPRNTEPVRSKNVSESEAEQRLRYLSDLSDSRGWSVRNIHQPMPMVGNSMNADVFNEAQQTQDILDDSGSVAQNIDYMIAENDQRRHQATLSQFQAAASAPAAQQPVAPPIPDPYTTLGQPATPVQQDGPAPQFNPYPTSMSQSVIQPLSTQTPETASQPSQTTAPEPPQSTSVEQVSPDIINLANNADLSIETIAREAHRITEKEADLNEDEVVISLR